MKIIIGYYDIHRLDRLSELLSLLTKNTFDKIHTIRDDKGTLVVTWIFMPTPDEKNILKTIWEYFNELEVKHEML